MTGSAATRHALQVSTLGGSVNFQTAVELFNGANWLTVTPSSGTATASQSATLTLQTNPAALTAGVYQALITITDTTTRAAIRVPLVLAVTGNAPRMLEPGLGAIHSGPQRASARAAIGAGVEHRWWHYDLDCAGTIGDRSRLPALTAAHSH